MGSRVDDIAVKLDGALLRIDALEKAAAEAASVPPVKANTGFSELSTEVFMAQNRARVSPRTVGPVPMTEDGRIVDPSWTFTGKKYVQRNLITNEVIQEIPI